MDSPRGMAAAHRCAGCFAVSLRRFVALAALASLLLNLALLVPSLYTLQVFDRVFASRSIETLLMLSGLTLLALVVRLLHGRGARAVRWPPPAAC